MFSMSSGGKAGLPECEISPLTYFRILYNVLLVRCRVRRILPRDYVLAFPTGECDEKLIELPEHKNIRIDEEIISGKLLQVADRLGSVYARQGGR